MSWFMVTIPTRDSAGWIADLIGYYRRYDITPIILLDSRTTDATRSIVEALGCTVVPVNGFTFTEGIVSLTRQCVPTPWVLFMHDDEAPSLSLLHRLRGDPPPQDAQSVAIPRRWAWHVPGQPLSFGRSDQWPDRTGQAGLDHAWRLFRPDKVRFVDVVHSEGFRIDRWARCPPDAFFVHFEWVLRTHAQRVLKLRRYDRHRYGYGRFFERAYLPEQQPAGTISFLPFEDDTFDGLAAAYYRSRKPDVPIPRLTAYDLFQRCRHAVTSRLFPLPLDTEPKDRIGLTPSLDKEVAWTKA